MMKQVKFGDIADAAADMCRKVCRVQGIDYDRGICARPKDGEADVMAVWRVATASTLVAHILQASTTKE